MNSCVCVLIYAVHKDNGTSGSSVRDVALSVGFGLYIHTDVAQRFHRHNRRFHRLYIAERYPADSVLGTTKVQPGDGRGRGGAVGDEESRGEETSAGTGQRR